MEHEEKSNIVYDVLDILLEKEISADDKVTLIEIVKSLDKKTELQKQRFLIFYNLVENSNKGNRLCDIARSENKTPSAIRTSIGKIRSELTRIDDKKILKMKEILEKYSN